MATRKELEDALIAADKAGNVEDARAIADALHNYSGTPNTDKVMAEWDSLPWYQKPLVAADDIVRAIANGATFGMADKLAEVATPWATKEEMRKASDEAKIRSGSAGTAAELLGMVLPSSVASKAAGAATRMTANTIGETIIREGVAGAGTGAISALADTTDPGELATSAGIGAVTGAAGGAVGQQLGRAINYLGSKVGINGGPLVDKVVKEMDSGDLKKAVGSAYDKVDNLGVTYDPSGFAAMQSNMASELNKARINPRLHPNASAMMDDIHAMTGTGSGSITPRDLDELRQVVNRDVTGSRGEDYMAGIMRSNIDNFIEKGPTNSGTGDAANKALREARDLNRRMRLSEDIDSALYRGGNAASDRGDVNALRSILNNPNKTRGMGPDEKSALQRVVRGSALENILNDFGGGPATPLGAGILVGGTTGNPLAGLATSGAVWAAEPAIKAVARKYTDANIANLRNVVSGGSTTPAAVRGILSDIGQAAGVKLGNDERKKVRRKKRD